MVFDCLDSLDVINITTDNNFMLTIKEQKIMIKNYLGLILDHKLQLHDHIEYIKKIQKENYKTEIKKRIGINLICFL